jgi:hypothetical protein
MPIDRLFRRSFLYEFYGLYKSIILSDYDLVFMKKPKVRLIPFTKDQSTSVQWIFTEDLKLIRTSIPTRILNFSVQSENLEILADFEFRYVIIYKNIQIQLQDLSTEFKDQLELFWKDVFK